MACNPNEGIIKEINEELLKKLGIEHDSTNSEESFNLAIEKLKKDGFTSIFRIGEEIEIKGCKFIVNNFVEEYGFMNLKIVQKDTTPIN